MAHNRLDPIGEERADMRAATVAATMANLFRGENDPVIDPEVYMPRYGERHKKITDYQQPGVIETEEYVSDPDEDIGPDQAAALFEMLNAMYGGVDTRRIK
jgi:hypothetical protein